MGKENKIEVNRNYFKKIESRLVGFGFTRQKFESECSFALQIWNNPKNSYLRKCTPESLLRSIVNLSSINLTLNPAAKEAYLVPRRNGDLIEVCLEPSYIGLVKLITDTGTVKNIQTNIVYEGDLFDVDLGIETRIVHKPYYVNKKTKGQIIGVYSIGHLSDGNIQYEFMDNEEISTIKQVSESYKAFEADKIKTCTWMDYEGEMYRKTVLRRITKYLPRSGNNKFLDNAIQLDNEAFTPSGSTITYIESLIRNSTLLNEQKEAIERELPIIDNIGANKLIKYLSENQLDPVTEKGLASATDIKNFVKEKTEDPRS